MDYEEDPGRALACDCGRSESRETSTQADLRRLPRNYHRGQLTFRPADSVDPRSRFRTGISRIPVLNAYAQLLAEGYFESRTGAGTFVSSSLPDQLMSCEHRVARQAEPGSGPRLVSSRSALLPHSERAPWMHGWGPFSVGHLTFDHFPFHVWSSLVARHCRNMRAHSLNYGDPIQSRGCGPA